LINGEQVILSEVTADDIDFLYELLKERKHFQEIYGNDVELIPPFEQHERFVRNYLEKNEQNVYEAWYIISILKDNKLEKVGSIPLKKDGEWGYQLLKKYHNRGIGQTAAKKLFNLHSSKKFWGKCKANNKRAIHLLEKLGFELTELIFEKKN